MKITQLLDRPIAFHRVFVTLTGSVKAAVMLSQAVYWQSRAKQADGWWYKTAEDWQEETGLTRHEQNKARKDCAKYLKSDLRGVPATLFWRVDEDALQADLFDENAQPSFTESGKLVVRNQSNINRNTETTTETTSMPNISDEKKTGEPTHKDPIIKAMFDCGMFPNTQTHDYLKTWREKHTDTRILEALKVSTGKSQKYMDSVLIGWEANGYPLTREQRIEAAKNKNNEPARPRMLPSGL